MREKPQAPSALRIVSQEFLRDAFYFAPIPEEKNMKVAIFRHTVL
jgi:hypothetical protein